MSQRQPSLARRAFPAIALTAVGVGMVQTLDRSSLPIAGVSAASVNAADGTLAPTDTAATTPPTSGSASAAGGVPTATVAPSATTVAPAVTAAPVTAAPVTAAPVACGAMSGTGAAGDITARRNYGTVTVTAKFTADGTLCSASATYNVYDQKSVRYEEYSIPILNKQAEVAHSANIQGISGATAISSGYRASLQSAIDNKH